MKELTEIITNIVEDVFTQCNYHRKYGQVTLSSRPDLCQFQCNGALADAKEYRKNPVVIASEIISVLRNHPDFKEVSCAMPGFINITLEDHFIVSFINDMITADKFGCEEIGYNKTIIVDYGGPNVAKPLHVGHLRSAIIGEGIKRIGKE